MKSIWGYTIPRPIYSHKTIELFKKLLPERRNLFVQEYRRALSNPEDSGILKGSRFDDDEKILYALESNVDESVFKILPKEYLDAVLMGAAESDYYYTFEKEY